MSHNHPHNAWPGVSVDDPSQYDFDENIRWLVDAGRSYPFFAWIKVSQSKFNRKDDGHYAAAKLDQNTEAYALPTQAAVDQLVRQLNVNVGWPPHILKTGSKKKIDFSAITRDIVAGV